MSSLILKSGFSSFSFEFEECPKQGGYKKDGEDT